MLIGLTGYAGSGKDATANRLCHEYGFEKRAFADKMREMTYALNPALPGDGVDLRRVVDQYGWDKAKRLIPGVREVLQTHGHNLRAVFGEDFWVDQVLPTLYSPRVVGFAAYQDIVISDVRYPNEARRIRELGGFVVGVRRAGVGPVNDHVSERQLPTDDVVTNYGTLHDLYAAIDRLIIRLNKEN